MGFEQLASLKEQLAKQAQSAKQAEAKPAGREASDPAPAAKRQDRRGDARVAGGKGAARGEARGEAKRADAGDVRASTSDARTKPAGKPRNETVDPVVLTIGQLQRRFPKVFPKSPAPKLPLKLGIHKDLLAQAPQLGMTEPALLEAIKTWCRGTRYWACIVENAVRVDLAGEEAGRVLPTEAARARSLEANRHRRAPAKKAAVVAVAPEAATAAPTEASSEAAVVPQVAVVESTEAADLDVQST
jgi:ProP effector